MEKISLTEDMKTGITIVDKQHREFIKECLVVESCAKNPALCFRAVESMKKLDSTAKEHFVTEEEIFNASMYPDKKGHARLHVHFLAELHALKKKSESGKAGKEFAHEVREKLTEWFVLHIKKNDMEMASYILKKQ